MINRRDLQTIESGEGEIGYGVIGDLLADEDLPDLETCQQKIPALIDALQPRLQRLDDDYRIQNCFLKMKFYDFNQTTVERQMTEPNYADHNANSAIRADERAWGSSA